ncbi:reverse transcriptase domain-containing protein [Tanacetum coccineum]
MQTHSSSKFVSQSSTNPPSTSTNPKHRNRRRSKQRVEPFALEEILVVTMADQRTMAELLRAPTEGYAEAIVVPPIPAEHFELKHTRIWLDKEPPRSILTWDDLVSKFINHFFPPSKTTNLRNEISNFQQRFEETFYEAWDRFKDLLRACHHHSFTELHQLDTFYNGLNPSDQDSLNSAAGGNLLERIPSDALKIIENKSKIRNSRNKPIVSQSKASNVDSSEIANAVSSAVTSAMTEMLKNFQPPPAPASVKAVEESCVTCGGAHSYQQCPATDGNTFSGYYGNIQGYVSAAAANYNQGNAGYRSQGVANQIRPTGFAQPNVQNNQPRFNQDYNQSNTSYQVPIQTPQVATSSDLEKLKKMNEVNIKAMQTQINNVKNELRNEMKSSIQASMSNQTNELKNMMASFFQMNTASTSGTGSLPSNTVLNPKGELKAITTRSGLVLDGPSVPISPPFVNPEEDEREEETFTDQDNTEFTIKVPPPPVQQAKPPKERNFMIHTKDSRHPNIPYPSRMNQEKQKEKDEV